MAARSLFQIAGGKKTTAHRTGQPVRRNSYRAGKRNGPLGAIGVDVLRELMRMIDFKTGRLEPAIAKLAERLRRSRGAIVSALARLKDHGFLNWIRRFEPVEDADPFGPQVKQVTNAYWFGLPKEAADMVRRMIGNRHGCRSGNSGAETASPPR